MNTTFLKYIGREFIYRNELTPTHKDSFFEDLGSKEFILLDPSYWQAIYGEELVDEEGNTWEYYYDMVKNPLRKSMTILPEDSKNWFLKHKSIGKKSYEYHMTRYVLGSAEVRKEYEKGWSNE